MVTIVDYGMGNLASIKNMLKKIGTGAEITSDSEVLKKATKIILPGVGAFDNAMDNIKNRGLLEVLTYKAMIEQIPFLGICLGMQILMNKSEEGTLPGLGWINGQVKRFTFEQGAQQLKVPHMGWNLIEARDTSNLFRNLNEPRFYFVHSYYVHCENEEDILATTKYGIQFVSSVRRVNIFGTQFHPEKSHKFGMQVLRNFLEIK